MTAEKVKGVISAPLNRTAKMFTFSEGGELYLDVQNIVGFKVTLSYC